MKLPRLIPSIVVVVAAFLASALFCDASEAQEKLAPDIVIPAQLPQGHPRIYAFESDRESLLKKIRKLRHGSCRQMIAENKMTRTRR